MFKKHSYTENRLSRESVKTKKEKKRKKERAAFRHVDGDASQHVIATASQKITYVRGKSPNSRFVSSFIYFCCCCYFSFYENRQSRKMGSLLKKYLK